MFGCGAVAQLVLSGGTHGMFLTVNFAFGFAATLGILVCGQISGKQSYYFKVSQPHRLRLFLISFVKKKPHTHTQGISLQIFEAVKRVRGLDSCIDYFQGGIWTLPWPLPCAYLAESVGGSFQCTSSFKQSVHFLELPSSLACTTVRKNGRHEDTECGVTFENEQNFSFFVILALVDALWDLPDSFNMTGAKNTAGIFATYPGKHLTIVNGFFDQVFSFLTSGYHWGSKKSKPGAHFNLVFSQIIGTAALIVCILAIVDPYNNPIPQGLEAFTVGFVVLVIGLSMGFNSGYAVNPARDLGPRIFTAMAGWGTGVFT